MNEPIPMPFPIFGPHHEAQIQQHMSNLNQMQDEIAKAKAAGLSVADIEARHSKVKAALQAIHNVYFGSK